MVLVTFGEHDRILLSQMPFADDRDTQVQTPSEQCDRLRWQPARQSSSALRCAGGRHSGDLRILVGPATADGTAAASATDAATVESVNLR